MVARFNRGLKLKDFIQVGQGFKVLRNLMDSNSYTILWVAIIYSQAYVPKEAPTCVLVIVFPLLFPCLFSYW